MAEMRLTERQSQAVYQRGGNLLVSAAAGSGKTSVLAKRIVSLVEEGADIRRMLVVTYTSLAAAEMRERIRKELSQRAQESGRYWLEAQAEYVQVADICTIHSFAARVIRENFLALGLPQNLRVGGQEEGDVLKDQALEQVFSRFYEEEDADFLSLRDRYSGRTDDKLKQMLLRIYEFCTSRAERLGWLEGAAENFDEQGMLDILRERCEIGMKRLCALLQRGQDLELTYEFCEKQEQNNQRELEQAQELTRLLHQNFDAFGAAVSAFQISALERKSPAGEGKELLRALKAKEREILKELKEVLPSQALPLLRQESAYMRSLASSLHRVLIRFEKRYAQMKREAHMLDYDDMISHAYRLLQDKETAERYCGRYDYIFVDEYQDTNPVQEALISCISRGDNRFMVGDIKQSIYRFRLADPLIFLKKTREFEEGAAGQQLIRMNENFRSAPGVIRPINFIMSRLMSRGLGEMEYSGLEQLIPKQEGGGQVELLLTQFDAQEDEEQALSAAEKEAHSVAKRILELLEEKTPEGKPVYAPSDICVLLRKTKENTQVFAEVFAGYGLDSETPDGRFTQFIGVEVFVNLLKLVDSFGSDLALLSVMKSHIGGFDEAEMALIRQADREHSFYDAFARYAQYEDALGEKCRVFLGKIRRWRLLSRGLSLASFLTLLKNETDYLAHLAALPGGRSKKEAFSQFFERCLGYAGRQRTLFGLVGLLEEINKNKGAYSEFRQAGDRSGCIRIMSVHKSKGLEFPVVILARMDSRFSNQDLQQSVLLHSSLGLASDIINEKQRTIRPTLTRSLFAYVMSKEMKSEELRVLYVAMTRARERLILSGVIRKQEEQLRELSQPYAWYDLIAKKNPLEWVLAALLPLPCMADWYQGSEKCLEDIPIFHRIVSPEAEQREGRAFDLRACLLEAGRAPYRPFLKYQAERIPVKIGVSTLRAMDDAEGEVLPAFHAADSRPEAEGGARLGTLVHLFLQHLDFSSKSMQALEEEAARMVRSLLLTEEEVAVLRGFFPQILDFMKSDLAYRIRASGRVLKEVPFSLFVTAQEVGIARSQEKVMVQGIIDLAFEEEGQWILVDYKSNMADENRLIALASAYQTQISLYKKALERITGQPVAESYLYLLRARTALRMFG